MQMERNLRVMSEASEIARGNGEAMVTAACSAADGVAALAETTAQMSRRLIESGMEFSRTMLDSNAVRGLAQSEENVAQSFYSNVNEQILRFNEAVMRTTDGMMKPIRDSISNAASAVSSQTKVSVDAMTAAAAEAQQAQAADGEAAQQRQDRKRGV